MFRLQEHTGSCIYQLSSLHPCCQPSHAALEPICLALAAFLHASPIKSPSFQYNSSNLCLTALTPVSVSKSGDPYQSAYTPLSGSLLILIAFLCLVPHSQMYRSSLSYVLLFNNPLFMSSSCPQLPVTSTELRNSHRATPLHCRPLSLRQ